MSQRAEQTLAFSVSTAHCAHECQIRSAKGPVFHRQKVFFHAEKKTKGYISFSPLSSYLNYST